MNHIDLYLDLADAETTARLESGDLVINIANASWLPHEYHNPYRNVSVPLAMELASIPAIKQIDIFYDPNEDYHHVKFTLDGHVFDIRWYKIYVVRRDDGKETPFGRSSGIVPWFKAGKHKG